MCPISPQLKVEIEGFFMQLFSKLTNLLSQVPYIFKALKLIWKTAPGWTVIWILLLVIQGLLPVSLVYLTRSVVDSLVAVLNSGSPADWYTFKPVLVPLVLMVVIMIMMAIIRSGLTLIRAAQAQLVQDRITTRIQEKSVALDLSFYESAEYYDKLHRARNDASYRPVELIESMSSLFQNTITLIAMASVLIPYSIWAPIALIVSTLPVLYVVLLHRLRYYHWQRKNTNLERKAWYYDWLLTSRENASEIRIFELGNYFMSAWYNLRKRLRMESIQLYKHQSIAELGAAIFSLLITGGAMGWMIWRTVHGLATMGDLALFYQAFNQGQRLLRSLLDNMGQMYSSTLFLGDLFEFFKLEPVIKDPEAAAPFPEKLVRGIKFNNVTFSYPDSVTPVLDNFSLDIAAGKITAIVGANGAGKSTLVKLICRLYDPAAGSVTFDGIDIRDSRVSDVRRMITVLFQESVRFNTTVAGNIVLGDLSVPEDSNKVMQAARESGADGFVAKLPSGYETVLGRWFAGSTDLSGGEWQRIALARAFLRRSPIIILDEPTSSMDSWSEMDWLKKFRQLASGRTAVIIAHRFTTAMQADVIHVMENGRVVESGSHHELVNQDGRYASSWREQVRDSVSRQPQV